MEADNDSTVQRLNLNLLYALDAILHTSTLTEAGRRVNLTPSAMSHALRRLRTHFRDDLMVHSGGESHLSMLGRALRPEVRRIMREVEGAFNYSIAFDPGTTRETITIAATETCEQMLLGPILRSLFNQAPGLRVNVIPLDIEQPQRSLDSGADLLLLSEDMAVAELETMPVLTDWVACLVSTLHPDFKDCVDITEAQYRAARHVIARGEVVSTFARDHHGLEILRARNVCVRATSQATLPAIIMYSELVATGSSWLFQYYARVMPLKVFAVPFERREMNVLAQWPPNRAAPMVRWFTETLKSHFATFYLADRDQ